MHGDQRQSEEIAPRRGRGRGCRHLGGGGYHCPQDSVLEENAALRLRDCLSGDMAGDFAVAVDVGIARHVLIP